MSVLYKPRTNSNKLSFTKGTTLGQLLASNGLTGQLDTVALYNWATKDPAAINRALVELVGCAEVKPDPLDSVLDPALGTTKAIHKPEPWQADLDLEKVYTIKAKKRLPATAVAITELTPWFDPAKAQCSIKIRYEGAAARADKREWEVHATGYFDAKPDANGVLVDKPCGTDVANDPTHTHILRRNKAAAAGTEETIPWDGTSDATEGILKNSAKICSRCAPYMVLVRYFKDDADKDTRIKLDPFYPRWKLIGKGRREIIEESLVVKWKLEAVAAAKAKLKHGQIAVYDKDGIVFIAPLTEAQIASGKYDLLKEPVNWNKTNVHPEKLPYRIQIQVHSDADEENGLALAVMPTQVPAYAYKQVQLVGFNICNYTKGKDLAGNYVGDQTAKDDIAVRAAVMIEAIQKAYVTASTDREILKVFVAPEFYWRGAEGVYPIGDISTILPTLRKELDQEKYLDWLFVLGTAIGEIEHQQGSTGIEHGSAIHKVKIATVQSTTVRAKWWTPPKKGWVFRKVGGTPSTEITADAPSGVKDLNDDSTTSDITLGTVASFANGDDCEMIEPVMTVADTWTWPFGKTQIKVTSAVCSRIPVDSDGNVLSIGDGKWKAVCEGITSEITKVVYNVKGACYWLTLASGGANWKGKPLKLIEPVSTEVFNVALIQKGWPAPHMKDGSLREIIVYKEYISRIDFLRDSKLAWSAGTGKNRKIKIHGTPDHPVLPTAGSKDLLGANPNKARQGTTAVGSEMNLSGLGGGSVFTMDGVTFGLEVCLDHSRGRLWDFYNGPNKRKGDPQVQVHLIPSWGMTIGGGDGGKEVTALENGLVFNVDGARMESVARVWDKKWSCDDHPSENSSTCIPCPSCTESLKQLGTALPPSSSAINVPKSNNTKYFKQQGNVLLFPAKNLPDPDVVP